MIWNHSDIMLPFHAIPIFLGWNVWIENLRRARNAFNNYMLCVWNPSLSLCLIKQEGISGISSIILDDLNQPSASAVNIAKYAFKMSYIGFITCVFAFLLLNFNLRLVTSASSLILDDVLSHDNP